MDSRACLDETHYFTSWRLPQLFQSVSECRTDALGVRDMASGLLLHAHPGQIAHHQRQLPSHGDASHCRVGDMYELKLPPVPISLVTRDQSAKVPESSLHASSR
jgi:hypothetical protein